MEKKTKTLIGAHMSIEGGFYRAIERGESINCTALQIFTKSNRQWQAKPLEEKEIRQFKETLEKSSVQIVVAHASYLINLASAKIETRLRSINALKKELERCHALGIPYLVLHPGSHVSQTEEAGLQHIINGCNTALEEAPGTTMILLETMAGQGTSLGHSFESLAFIRANITNKKRVGICFDTCHVFAAGYNFSSKKDYELTMSLFDKTIGLPHLKIIHINDSKKECASRIDRHEHIGKGKIGLAAFSFIMNDQRLLTVPKILETPKDSLLDDKKNMDTLKNLISPITKTKIET